MSFYDNFKQEDLADLLRAYDSYISTAADAGLLTTGWTPVCVAEFYDTEYQNVWDSEKGDESFYYMYDNAEAMVSGVSEQVRPEPSPGVQKTHLIDPNGTSIFTNKAGDLMCQFEDEDEPRHLRSRIQDIQEGDGFIVGSMVRIADDSAHQNLDERDEPWIVYDVSGEGWFEEDIKNAERIVDAIGRPAFAPTDVMELGGTRIIREMTHLFCQLPGEEEKHPIRNRIQDIKEGDAFLVGKDILIATEAARQDLNDPHCAWVVFDTKGGVWFEGDIANAERAIRAMEHGKAFEPQASGIPVTLVNIIRERPSENEAWSDAFWVDARKTPSPDLFRAAVQDYLSTGDGHISIQRSSEDFNWGDAIMDVPDSFWNLHGIYPVDHDRSPREMGLAPTPNCNPIDFKVDQDEILIPDSYFEEKAQEKTPRPLNDIISQAEAKVKAPSSIAKAKEQEL